MVNELQQLSDLMEQSGVRLLVGLREQGHMPTVARMLDEGRSWDEIGKAIGWTGDAVREDYPRQQLIEAAINKGRREALAEVFADVRKLKSPKVPTCYFGMHQVAGWACQMCGGVWAANSAEVHEPYCLWARAHAETRPEDKNGD